MADLSVKLSDAQLEKSIATLTRLEAVSKGEDKKNIQTLLEKMSTKLRLHQEAIQVEQDEKRFMLLTQSAAKIVLDTLPMMKKRGITPSLVRFLERVETSFDQAEQNWKEKNPQDSHPRRKKNRVSPTEITNAYEKEVIAPLVKQLTKAAATYKAATDAPILASSVYSHASERARLAKDCLLSGISEAERASEWGEVEMVAMTFSDGLTHIRLGAALLDGNPKTIERASYMDTATREALSEDVWDFLRGGEGLENVKKVSLQKASSAPRSSPAKPSRRARA